MNRSEFSLLAAIERGCRGGQRELSRKTGLSLGTVNAALRRLIERGLIDAASSESQHSRPSFSLTDEGRIALKPYRVDNAVIMAAGLSSRFAPISYERPKGVLKVRGEVLIERQIRQLQEAGITEIMVVVGYKKEEFFYLEDMYGVEIVVNPDYAVRNNNSTIMRVANRLGNTYICSSDDYFTENPFEPYVYDAYYAAVYAEGPTDEYCLVTRGRDARIVGVEIGGHDSWVMMGHAYWDRAFSEAFTDILRAKYDEPTTAGKLWEDIYLEHLDTLRMVKREYESGVIWEFDSLADLRLFDLSFIDNVDSEIMDNIARVLRCDRRDISGIVPIKQGLTNLSFKFEVKGEKYVYRHPGDGTEQIINRRSETRSQEAGARLGIDKTFIFEDEERGWKISRFVEVTDSFDYHNPAHVRQAMRMIRRLHESGEDTGFAFDIHEDTKKQIALLDEGRRASFRDFGELFELADSLNNLVAEDGLAPVLCHNDFYDPNLLISGEEMYLIDWEYSGMSDYASDLAVFIACSDYTYDEAMGALEAYFDGPLSDEDLLHNVAYLSVVSFHWFIWALYKDMCGDPVGEYLYLWYKYTKMYGRAAVEMAEKMGRSVSGR